MGLPVEGENAAGSSVEGCVPVEGITREISCWQAALSPVAGILWLSVESILLFSAASRPQHSQGCMSCAMMTNVKEEEPGQKPTSRDEPGQEQTLAEPKHEEATSAEQPFVAPLPSNVPCTLKEQIEGAFMQVPHLRNMCSESSFLPAPFPDPGGDQTQAHRGSIVRLVPTHRAWPHALLQGPAAWRLNLKL